MLSKLGETSLTFFSATITNVSRGRWMIRYINILPFSGTATMNRCCTVSGIH